MRIPVMLATLAVAASCNEPAAPQVVACDGTIPISVNTTGSKPVFSWTPSCGITYIQVRPVNDSVLMEKDILWGFSTNSQSDPRGVGVATPGIVYGQAPAGAYTWPTQSLRMGTTYKVVVEYHLGGDMITASGFATFTWPYGPD